MADFLPLQIMGADFRVEPQLRVLEQHDDIGPAEQKITELLALGQRGPGFDGQIDRRDV